MEMQGQTKLTAASVLELTNGTLSLIGAALAILSLTRDGIIEFLEPAPLMILALLLGLMGVIYVTLGMGLLQQRNWARSGSFIAGAIGVPVGLGVPIPLLSAAMSLVMLWLLRDPDVRAIFEEAGVMASLWTTPTDLMEQESQETQGEWEPATLHDQEATPETHVEEPMTFQQGPKPPEQPGAKTELLERQPEHLAWLIPTTGTDAGAEFRLRDVTTVGREAGNDIVVRDAAISGRHLRIRLRDDQFILHDLATRNGTIVNGESRLRHPLVDGDLIQIGNTTLLFMQVTADADQS